MNWIEKPEIALFVLHHELLLWLLAAWLVIASPLRRSRPKVSRIAKDSERHLTGSLQRSSFLIWTAETHQLTPTLLLSTTYQLA